MERDLDASGRFEAAERFFYHADSPPDTVAVTASPVAFNLPPLLAAIGD